MKIYEAKDYKEMSRKAANILSAQVILKPDCVLGLATGSTPIGTYDQLVEWYEKGDVDFSEVKTVNLDEYRGLTRDNDQSYYYFMHEHLFDRVNIKPENTNVPDGTEPDAEKECARYEKLIESMGGVDIQLLGLGHNGHILAEDLTVQPQEVSVGQAALGVAVAGPGITEVDVDPADLAGSKEIGQLVGVGVDEIHVGQTRIDAPLHGHHHGIGHPLHRDEQHIRLRRCGTSGKAAFAAAQLQPNLTGLGHEIPPVALMVIGVPDQKGSATVHSGDQILLFPHAHGKILLGLKSFPKKKDHLHGRRVNFTTQTRRCKCFPSGKAEPFVLRD